MYDELQRLQYATKAPIHRGHGVNVILRGLKLSRKYHADGSPVAIAALPQ
jgi:hypothetical protein